VTANYKDYFLYLSSRDANTFPDLGGVEFVIQKLEDIKLPQGKECIRSRAVCFDNKHQQFSVFADYLYPSGREAAALSPAKLNVRVARRSRPRSDESAEWYLTFGISNIYPQSKSATIFI
jgi:hypothetical protein